MLHMSDIRANATPKRTLRPSVQQQPCWQSGHDHVAALHRRAPGRCSAQLRPSFRSGRLSSQLARLPAPQCRRGYIASSLTEMPMTWFAKLVSS